MKLRLSQLYQESIINLTQLVASVFKKYISLTDALEIVGEKEAFEFTKLYKLSEISKSCNSVIVGGIDITFDNRTDHFNLSLEDQSNINNLFRVIELGGSEYPYQADDGTCIVYSSLEIVKIYTTAQTHITTQTAYHNALKQYLLSIENLDELNAVYYGMELPEIYQQELNSKLSVANSQLEAILSKLGIQQ